MLNLVNLCALALSVVCLVSAEEYAPIVKLKDGEVRGIVQEGSNGHKVHLYQGIRYGRAQRFEKPKPVEPWTELYNATTYRDACVQFGSAGRQAWLLDYTKTDSEDCLFLNVWSPQSSKNQTNRPVMVWIHGGAFESGTIFAPIFDGRYLADQGNVVVVSINYRLGPFGFLYSGTEDAPGNVGLHDQILGLQWVQQNIDHFGGNKHSVTIFGQSAGSASVGALILSPLAKGLFTRAIMQSGAPNTIAVLDSVDSALTKTHAIARKLNCSSDKMNETLSCLKTKPLEEFVNVTVGDFARNELYALVYGDEVLPYAPVQALKSGKFNRDVDLLYGVTANEGSIFTRMVSPDVLSKNLTLNTLKEEIVHMNSRYSGTLNWSEIADYYIQKLPNQPNQDDLKTTLSAVFGDNLLVCPTIFFAEQMSFHSPTSNYYSYRLVKNVNFIRASPSWFGVQHGTDLYYLFGVPLIQKDSAATQLSLDMIRAWTNFAKSGHPGKMGSVLWTEAINPGNAKNHNTQHLNLDSANYRMVENYYSEICNTFWKPRIFV